MLDEGQDEYEYFEINIEVFHLNFTYLNIIVSIPKIILIKLLKRTFVYV